MSSYSPPPSPSGRTSSGNYLRSNFLPGRERPSAQVFSLQDEGKGTPAWMKKLLEQKKAEYRARWGELPDDDDKKDKSSSSKPPQMTAPSPAPRAVVDDEDHDGETIEEIIYEEEIIEEVVVEDDNDDEYTEEEIVTTDDEYTYEEVVTSGDEEEPVAATRKGGKRPTPEMVPPPARSMAPRTTPTPMKSRAVEASPAPLPIRPASPQPRATQPAAPRNSFSLQRMMADEVAASPTTSPRASVTPKSTPLSNSARPAASPVPRTTTPSAVASKAPAAANEAALRAQLAALEAQLAEARRRQGSPSPPRERPATTASPPAAVPATTKPRAASRLNVSQTARPAPARAASPPPPPKVTPPPPRTQSPPPPPIRAKSPPPSRAPSPPPRANSPKRVQFSETATPPPPPPAPAATPPFLAYKPPSSDEGDSMYDYVIEIDTVSSSAGASTSVYEIEYEDGSTIASRPDRTQRVPPTIQEGDEEMPAQQKEKEADMKPKSRNRVLAMWLGCCAVLLLLLLGGLVAGAFLVEDELDFLPFVGDDSGDDSASATKDLEGNITKTPTSEPMDTIAPTDTPVATSPATSPAPANGPNTTPSPPTSPPTMDSEPSTEAVSTFRPTLFFVDYTTGRPTLSLTSSPTAAMTTNSPTAPPTSAPMTSPPTSIPIFTPPTPPPVEPPPPGPSFEWTLTSGPFTSAENSGFGEAVAMDGNILVVGAPGSGRVLAYSRSSNSNTWSALNEVSPSEEAGDFGAAVAISVGTSRVAMAVGAPSSLDSQGYQMPFGAAFYYELTGQDWTQFGSRAAPSPNVFNAGGEAGAAVAVAAESRRMAVGAPSVTIDAENIDNGQVSVYEFDGTELNLLSTVDGIEPGGLFGFAVRMTSNGIRLLVGAPGSSGSSTGAVYYYEWGGTSWRMILPVPGSTPTENLGTSVAILDGDGDGDIVAMGGPNHDEGRGIIRVYRRQSGGFWGPLGGVIVGEPGEMLGLALSAGPNNGIVAGTSDSFRAFELIGSEWIRVGMGEPSFDSKVTSVGASGSGDIAAGIAGESVSIYGLGL